MPKRTVEKIRQFDCPKCDRSITFTYCELQFFESLHGEIFAATLDRIIDYGECLMAAESADPQHPSDNEVRDCPFYQALGGR